MPPLVWSLVLANTSTLHGCFVTLFTGCQSLRGYSSRLQLWPSTVSEVLVLSTSSKSSAESRICHVSHSARLAVVTCSFRGQTRRSASEVSPLRQFRSKLKTHLFRQAYNTAWILWEQFFVEEWNSVSVTITYNDIKHKCKIGEQLVGDERQIVEFHWALETIEKMSQSQNFQTNSLMLWLRHHRFLLTTSYNSPVQVIPSPMYPWLHSHL